MIEERNVIEVRNVTKSFKIYHERKSTLFDHMLGFVNRNNTSERLTVLDNITFDIKKGEMIGIVGRNGEGKTTLLRLLSRILKPDSGTIHINGSVVPFLELGTGFQPELTAKDNILLYGTLLGFTKKEMKEKMGEILSYAEIEKFADTKLKNFSSGMYSRLAFSTAIQVNPDILLVDEVLSVGDVPFQEKSFNTFMSFKKKGKTIVFVTHSLMQVQRLCDRAVFLNKGKIHSIGKPNEIINEFYRIVEGEANSSLSVNDSSPSNMEMSIIKRNEPAALAFNKNNEMLYVANIASDTVVVIDVNTLNIIQIIKTGASPREVAINPETNRIYVANRDSNSVSVIDGNTNRIIDTVGVGSGPWGLAVDESTNILYVSNSGSDSISRINGYNNSIIDNIESISFPLGISINQRTNMIYIANQVSDSITVIDGLAGISIANIGISSKVLNSLKDSGKFAE